MYLESFSLPIDKEKAMISKRMAENGSGKHLFMDDEDD